MITTTALTKSYKEVPVVRDVSLHCEPGTITGFLGANGAGKSTTLKMMVGLVRPDRGTATIDGRPFVELPNPMRVVGTLLDVLRCIPDAPAGRPSRSQRGWQAFTRGGSSTCWTSSGSPMRRRSGWGPTPSACANASASPRPSSVNRGR